MSPAVLTPAAMREALTALGLGRGDVALVHSDAIVAAQFPSMPDEERVDALIDSIESVLGEEGTLVMPAFSYSFTAGKAFDIRLTPSTVGMVTERFRTRDGVRRTLDPIFSFAAKGPLADRLAGASSAECFGPDSAFALLHELNAHIVCLGCSLTHGGTFAHYVERKIGVNYRFDKQFNGNVIGENGIPVASSVIYYVRRLDRESHADLRLLRRKLAEAKLLRTALAGRIQLLAVRAGDFFRTAACILKENPVGLTAEGANANGR